MGFKIKKIIKTSYISVLILNLNLQVVLVALILMIKGD